MANWKPCPESDPLYAYACQKPRGHKGLHHHSSRGRTLDWQTSVDVDETTPSGGRIRMSVGEITIEREG